MKYLITGSIAFLFLFYFDVLTIKNKGFLKKIFGLIGLGLLIYSSILIIITSEKIQFPLSVRVIAGIFWTLSMFLLIYSLFLELPFNKTYGKDEHANELIDTGTYALCRHPGVLWFALIYLSFSFVTGAKLLFIGAIIWTILDIIHVYLQEIIFFPLMFSTYNAYKKSTPMLIPNKNSVKKCLETVIIRRDKDDNFTSYVKK